MDEEKVKEPVQRNDIGNTGENKALKWLKKNTAVIFLILLSVFFIFNGSIKFVVNDMNWWEKIVYISTTLVFGVIISSLVAETGYESGKEDESYISTRELSIDLCQKALPLKKEAELYVSNKIDADIKAERVEILSKASINYNEIFSANGVPYPYKELRKKYSKKQRTAIVKAIKIKKIPFALFGFTPVKTVGRKEAPSENKRRSKTFLSKFIIKALIALLSGSVMFSFIGISIESAIYSAFQLLLWYGGGIMGRVQNKNFIINDVREYDQERIWYLQEFLALSDEEKKKLSEEISKRESQDEGVKRLTMNLDCEKDKVYNDIVS